MPQPAACVTLLGLAIPLLYVFLGWQGLWQRAIFDSMFRKHNPDVFLTVPKAEANPVLTSPNFREAALLETKDSRGAKRRSPLRSGLTVLRPWPRTTVRQIFWTPGGRVLDSTS